MIKRSGVTVEKFLDSIELGTPILETLKLTNAEFTKSSQEELLNNPDDIGAGVVRVEKKFDTLFFEAFTTLLVKHHDDGSARYIFFGITRDAGFIIRLSRMIFDKFGGGIYDSENYTSFKAVDKINSLARGKYITPKDSLMHVWLHKKYNLSLGYGIDPMRGLVLAVTEKPEKKIDTAIRERGTIADILKLDLVALTNEQPLDKRSTNENGILKFTDYYYQLSQPALNIFDVLKVRVFGLQPDYTPHADVNLEFTTSDVVTFEQIFPVIEQVIKIYGADHIGSNELEVSEVVELQNNTYWLGRMWHLNELHGLYDGNANEQKIIYTVSITNDEDSNGFTLSILSYNRISENFGEDFEALEMAV